MRSVSFVVAGVALIGCAASAVAKNSNPDVVPITAHTLGKTYGEWAGEWWNWVLNYGSTNPLLDTTGEHCAVGQTEKVWFLAGTTGNEELLMRTCTAPVGKHLFFPILNVFWAPDPCGDEPCPGPTPEEIEEVRQTLKEILDSVEEMWVEVDGAPVANVSSYRAASGPFTLTVTEDNIYGAPAGDYEPAYQEGYYLMLHPLSPGTHTVRFYAKNGGFTINVLYQLTVAQGPKP